MSATLPGLLLLGASLLLTSVSTDKDLIIAADEVPVPVSNGIAHTWWKVDFRGRFQSESIALEEICSNMV